VRDNPEVNKTISAMTALGRPGLPDALGPMIAALLSIWYSLFPAFVALRSTYPANRPRMLSTSTLSRGIRDGPAFTFSISRMTIINTSISYFRPR
jgi:hypothetical protein